MNKIAAVLMFLTVSMPVVGAATSACYAISDADARNYCIAKAKKDRSVCYNIQKADLRAQCMAEVG